MRRSLRCLLVGVLVFSLSVDTARACWYLRHAHRGYGYAVPACPPAPACGGWAVVVSDVPVATWGDQCFGSAFVAPAMVVEEIACGAPLDCCAGDVMAADSQAMIVERAPTIVAPQPAPTVVPPATETIASPAPPPPVAAEVQKPLAVAPATPTEPVLPDLQPVEPASASEPVVPPVPRVDEPVLATPTPPQPPAVNEPAVPGDADAKPGASPEKMEERPEART